MDLYKTVAYLLFFVFIASRLAFLPAEPKVLVRGMDQCFRKVFMVAYSEQLPFLGQLYLPFQPFISAIAYLLTQDALRTLPLLTMGFSLLLPILGYALVKDIYDEKTAILVLALLTSSSVIFTHSITSLSEVLASSLLLASVYLLHKKHYLSSALLYSCLVLSRDEQKFIAPFFIALYFWQNKDLKSNLLYASIILLSVATPFLVAWTTSGNPFIRWEYERQTYFPISQPLQFDLLIGAFILSLPLYLFEDLKRIEPLPILAGLSILLFLGFVLPNQLKMTMLYPRYLATFLPLMVIGTAPLLSRLKGLAIPLATLLILVQLYILSGFLSTISYIDYEAGYWIRANSGKNMLYDLKTLLPPLCAPLVVPPVSKNVFLNHEYPKIAQIHECWPVLSTLEATSGMNVSMAVFIGRPDESFMPYLDKEVYRSGEARIYPLKST